MTKDLHCTALPRAQLSGVDVLPMAAGVRSSYRYIKLHASGLHGLVERLELLALAQSTVVGTEL